MVSHHCSPRTPLLCFVKLSCSKKAYKPYEVGFLPQGRVMARDHTLYRWMPIVFNIWRRPDFDGTVRRWMPVRSGVIKSPGLAGGTRSWPPTYARSALRPCACLGGTGAPARRAGRGFRGGVGVYGGQQRFGQTPLMPGCARVPPWRACIVPSAGCYGGRPACRADCRADRAPPPVRAGARCPASARTAGRPGRRCVQLSPFCTAACPRA